MSNIGLSLIGSILCGWLVFTRLLSNDFDEINNSSLGCDVVMILGRDSARAEDFSERLVKVINY